MDMAVQLDKKLQDFMNEKGYKDIALDVMMCKTWAGVAKEISTRFVEGNVEELLGKGFLSEDTELGKVYYHPDTIRFGKNPILKLGSFMWSKYIRFRGVYAV